MTETTAGRGYGHGMNKDMGHEYGSRQGARTTPTSGAQGSGKRAEPTGSAPSLSPWTIPSKSTATGPSAQEAQQRRQRQRQRQWQRQKQHTKDTRTQCPAHLAHRRQRFGSRNRRTISTEFGVVLGMTARAARCARCWPCGQTVTGQGRAGHTTHRCCAERGVCRA